MKCLSNIKIREYIDLQLAGKVLKETDLHLMECEKCREKVQLEEKRTIQFKNILETLYPHDIPIPMIPFLKERAGRRKKPVRVHAWWATAAIFILAVFISLLLLTIRPSQEFDKNSRAIISETRLNGNPAKSYIFRSTNPEMTIFWLENDNSGDLK